MINVSLIDNFRFNLMAAMRREKISQSELARRAGVRRATVCDVLSGKMEPSITICEKLAAAAEMRPDLSFLLPESKAS